MTDCTGRGIIKDALSGLRQFLATESPLKIMKNAFYFTFFLKNHSQNVVEKLVPDPFLKN